MRVTCPACAATYDVPDARIGPGRRLRCARCQHDWFVQPPVAARTAEESPFARAMERAATSPPAAPPPPIAAAGAGPAGGSDHDDPGSGATAGSPPRDRNRDPDPSRPGEPDPASTAARASPASRATAPPSLSLPDDAARPAAPVRDRSGRLLVAWVATLMVFVGFAAAVVLYRIEIMEAWPPAERFYAAVGMLRR